MVVADPAHPPAPAHVMMPTHHTMRMR